MEGREVNIIYVTERRSQDKVEEEGHQWRWERDQGKAMGEGNGERSPVSHMHEGAMMKPTAVYIIPKVN